MRFWLITSTTYGTWLPGDERGFVGRVWDVRPDDQMTDSLRREHDQYGQPYDADIPGLKRESQRQMKGSPVWLNAEQAHSILDQFLETVAFRQWILHAASIMSNHFHAIVEAPDAVCSDDILGDLKSYASRRLNKTFGKPISGTWWTASGSKRPLRELDRLFVVIRYVLNQHRFLTRFLHPNYGTIDSYLSGGCQTEPSGGCQTAVDTIVESSSHGGLTPAAQEEKGQS